MPEHMLEPFRVAVPEADLDDLRSRLDHVRWPDELPGAGWDYGVPLSYLKELTAYWRNSYDWRKEEERLNRLDQFITMIDGARVHFYHARSAEPGAVPLLLLHGWPGSVVEFLDVMGPLTDPVAHGGEAGDAFHVVCPSLPGFAFSGPTPERGWHPWRIAHAMCRLMEILGYPRYAAHGTDWGSRIVRDMGLIDPDHLVAVHTSLLRTPLPAGEDIGRLTDEERDRLGDFDRFNAELSGYMHIQGTRPQTLAYALSDSPVGQLAWLAEKFKEWTDSENVPEDAVQRDSMLTNVMVYWLTGTVGSSSRIYYEQVHWEGNDRPDSRLNWNTPQPSAVPTGVAVSPRELFRSIRRFGERTDNIVRWTEFERGGHFSGLEVPELLVEDLRAFLRDFREALSVPG